MKLESMFKVSIVVFVFSSFYLFYLTGGYSGYVESAMDWHGYDGSVPNWLANLNVALTVTFSLIMFTYNIRARSAFFYMSILGLLLTFGSGIAAYTSAEMLFVQINFITQGIIIALSYTALSAEFTDKQQQPKQCTET